MYVHCIVITDSVFELVSGEDKARMEAAKMQSDILKKQLEKAPETEKMGVIQGAVVSPDMSASEASSTQHNSTSQLATTSPVSQTSLWKSAASFMPFAKNPEKQKRYEAYLEAMKYGKACKYRVNTELSVDQVLAISLLIFEFCAMRYQLYYLCENRNFRIMYNTC